MALEGSWFYWNLLWCVRVKSIRTTLFRFFLFFLKPSIISHLFIFIPSADLWQNNLLLIHRQMAERQILHLRFLLSCSKENRHTQHTHRANCPTELSRSLCCSKSLCPKCFLQRKRVWQPQHKYLPRLPCVHLCIICQQHCRCELFLPMFSFFSSQWCA